MKNLHSLSRLVFGLLLLSYPIAGFAETERSGENSQANVATQPPVSSPSNPLNFQTDLFTGRFGYHVPLPLAPARHSSEPDLSLVYNSAGDNTWCGVGWTLDLGYIQRETKRGVPVLWANGVPQKSYDDGKGFTFSLNGKGATLVPVGGNEYRAEIESGFLRFQFQTNNNQWQVIDLSGNKYLFGTNSAARMSNPKAGWSSNAWNGTYRWSLSHVETVLGDTVDYSYTNIGGTLYPLRISYNGHTNGLANSDTVDFILGTRTDVRVSYMSNYRVEQGRRLDAIVHKVSGQIVWSNRLNYVVSQSTYRTLLKSVVRYGTNLTSSLPPISFDYTDQAFGFQPEVNWTNLYLPTGGETIYTDISHNYSSPDTTLPIQCVDLMDMDGDGLPDRVIMPGSTPFTNLWVQHNNGSGFDNKVPFGPLSIQTFSNAFSILNTTNLQDWSGLSACYMRLLDINGDGLPDRVSDPLESLPPSTGNLYNRFAVQLNNSTNWQALTNTFWTGVVFSNQAAGDAGSTFWRAIEKDNDPQVEMLDMNGDGLPDRVLTRYYSTGGNFTNYWVQFNTGTGFTTTNYFSFPRYEPIGASQTYGQKINSVWVRFIDMNGDGLPDRIMFPTNASGAVIEPQNATNYVVEFNNGAGFEPPVLWGTNAAAVPYIGGCLTGNYTPEFDDNISLINIQDQRWRGLLDINGDGLPDRVFLQRCGTTNLLVQINMGTNFAAPVVYGPYLSQNQINDPLWAGIRAGSQFGDYTRFQDINGDGIPDHVMRSYPGGGTGNYLAVELSKGPFPDLLNSVSNGIGGSLVVNYKPSTQYKNTETTNSSPSRQLLPFLMQTVASVSVSDGLYPSNTTSYAYEGGKWNAPRREFDGFARTIEVDPLGRTNIHWFHQAGGRDNSLFGEYQDTTNAIAKRGLAFRTELVGTNGQLYQLVLNKVEDADLGSGRHFAFVSQTLTLDYPGNSNTNRATAEQFAYDLNTGNLTNKIDFGEVGSVTITNQQWSDIPGDTVYQSITYAVLGNTNILNKPQQTIVTSDAAGTNVLRERRYDYDGNTGNLLQQRDRMCEICYVTNTFSYDNYNNRNSATDEAGIVTISSYDSVYQTFLSQQITGSILTNSYDYDPRSGKLRASTAPTGFVLNNQYDAFLRITETDISTTSNGPANQWLARYDYRLGMSGGFSTNSIRTRKSDGVDSSNGHESWTYFDGFGRTLQIRDEAEVNGFRVVDTVYDKRGNAKFESLPYFSSGTNFTKPSGSELGKSTDYDPIGRPVIFTAAVNGTFSSGQLTGTSATSGDTGSPVAPSIIAYNDGNNPWAIVVTDEENQTHKYLLDAFGRTNQVIEVTSGGNLSTLFNYNLVGDLTSVTDSAGNQIQYAYNDLGQVVAMADPDMGVWQYRRDFAGRLREQIDANNQLIRFNYNDSLGRLKSREVYDYQGHFTYGATNFYDTSDDGNFTVNAGQLYKVVDNEGWTKNGYDIRGRVIETARYLSKNSNTYTNQFLYDDTDRVVLNVYPNGGPTITNIYDAGGNLSQVKQIGGSNTVFYAARGFNQLKQLIGVNFGNGVVTTNDYYTNSLRLRRTTTFKIGGTNIQNLSYTYDKVSNLKSIGDGVYGANASAALTNVAYDSLHRLTSITRPAVSQTTAFSYDSIGNITANGENGTQGYTYGIRLPHAVKTANGQSYAYDANGNMLVRGNQRLSYDPENRLAYVVTSNTWTRFGYDAAGARLWKENGGTNGLQVWIGNHYEEKNGQILFHVLVADRSVCTFDPTGTNVFTYYHPDHLHSTAIETDQSGNRIQHYEYMVFGQDRFTESSTAFSLSRRFTGQILDEDTGLYFYGGRYYDPVLGRFIQPDSTIPDLFDPQAYNRYSYVFNNPLKYFDPTGHEGYWHGVGQVFLGYYDAGAGLVKGTVFIVAHPVVTAQGIGQAIAHPVNTGKAIVNGVGDTWNGGLRGQGQVVGNVLMIAATVVDPGAEAGNIQKVEQVATSASKAEKAAEAVEEVAGKVSCFPAGTLVSTPSGYVRIEDLKPDDEVYSYDFNEDRITIGRVLTPLRNWTDIWIDITISGETIRATRGHPFWVESENTWIDAEHLKSGMVLLLENGETRTITKVARFDSTPDDTFNLIVSDFHNYFVGNNGILVHNGGELVNAVGHGENANVTAREAVARIKPGAKPVGPEVVNVGEAAPPSARGKPPIGSDGFPMELHHAGQEADSELIEMTRTEHRLGENFKKNHANTGQSESEIDRAEFNKTRKEYWKKEWDSGRWTKPKC
jgi:RHS repeat-associated protein